MQPHGRDPDGVHGRSDALNRARYGFTVAVKPDRGDLALSRSGMTATSSPAFDPAACLYELQEGFGSWDVAQHEKIYAAVRDSDGDLAAGLMREHILDIKSLYEQHGVG
jgi:hypothetical protein